MTLLSDEVSAAWITVASVGCSLGVEAEVKAGDKADDKLAESGRKGLHNCELPALKKGAGYFTSFETDKA